MQPFEGDPHAVMEGMMIAAYAIGANHGVFMSGRNILWLFNVWKKAMAQAREKRISRAKIS